MRKKSQFALVLLLLALLNSCFWNGTNDIADTEPFTQYQPVTMQRSAFELTTVLEPPKSIVTSGKIYVKDQYLFINEPNEGFHIYDNSNPENPINIAFLNVLGSSDLAIKFDTLYINNATDLIAVSIDYTTMTAEITKRISNAFPQISDPNGDFHHVADNEIIVDWNAVSVN